MSLAYYDIVVVGTELTGLMTAAMLSKKGYRVLVLGHGHRPNIYNHENHRFIRRPWMFSGFESSAPIKKVLVELSLSLEMHNRPKPYNPFYQVVLPGRRVDVVPKESLYMREIHREFPGDIERIQNFYEAVNRQNERLTPILDAGMTLPPDGFFEQRNFNKVIAPLNGGIEDPLRAFPDGHPFRPFVLAPLLFGSGCQVSPYSPIQLTRAVTHLNRGLYHIDGGIDAFKKIFLSKVTDNCGDYREKVSVDQLSMKRGKVREIMLRDRREVIGCDVVICNMDIKRFFNLIPQEDQKQRYHLRILELQPSHFLYTVNFAVKRNAIPEGMARHVFHVGDMAEPLENENLLMICVDPAGENPESDTRVLSVTGKFSRRSTRSTLDAVEKQDQRIIEQLRQIVPFFDENLVAKSSSWVGFDQRTRKRFIDTNQMLPIFGNPLQDTLDSSPIACKTAYKNILVTGDHLHSGLGFEGAFMGAHDAVKLTMDMVRRKTLLK